MSQTLHDELRVHEESNIEMLRRMIEEQYNDCPTKCGGSFGEILCYEIHSRPTPDGERGLTFTSLAQKWGISVSSLGELVWDHCKRLEALPKVNHQKEHCHAGWDGDCCWEHCPQTRDNEPIATGRHCPLWDPEKEDEDEH